MKKVFICITITLGILGAMLSTSTLHAGVTNTKDDCIMWTGTPYKVRNSVYASSSISCRNQKLHIVNKHSLTQNSRFWAWKVKASSYSKKTNAEISHLRTRYVCDGETATHKWRGVSFFEVKKDDNYFGGFFTKRVTGNKKTITCD